MLRWLPVFLLLLSSLAALADQTRRHYLSGTGMDDTVDWEFRIDIGMNSGEWTTIPVPSNWELQGFGQYHYGHEIRAHYRGDRPDLEVETGFYRHRFLVPDDWSGQHVRIVFEGAMTDTLVRLNGEPAGPVHQGGFYRFSHDVTDLLRYGAENLLEVEVSEQSADASVDQAERGADYWTFGGIYRPVYLEIKPTRRIVHFAVDAGMDGELTVSVECAGLSPDRDYTVRAVVRGDTGLPLGDPLEAAVGKGGEPLVLRGSIPGVLPWSAESPQLYNLGLALLENDTVQHRESARIGFRTVEMRPRDGFFINGKRIKFKGVNRHSSWPESGRALSRELSYRDARLIKEMNMNAVRMSHYPPDTHFLEACDELGLYVFNELTAWQEPPYDTEVGKKLVRSLVRRDVNHPSVVAWNNGNEGGFNTDLDPEFGRWDLQDRPVFHPWALFGGLDTTHYIPWDHAAQTFFHGREVFCPTEFLHGLYDGGHGAGLEDYWQRMWANPLSAGGFLWAFADEGIVRTDQGGRIDTDGNHAPDGIVSPWRDKEGSFFAIREIWCPVFLPRDHLPPSFDGTLRVENRFHFTNLSQCRFAWRLARLPRWYETGSDPVMTPVRSQPGPDVGPGESGFLRLDLPESLDGWDVLYLTVTDPRGQERFTWSWPLRSPAGQTVPEPLRADGPPPRIDHGEDLLGVRFPGYTVAFDGATGQLREVTVRGERLPLAGGPHAVPLSAACESIVAEERDGTARVVVTHLDSQTRFAWTLHASGLVELDYQLETRDRLVPKDAFGLSFDLEEGAVLGMTYQGDGPYRVWRNRMRGNRFGVWEKDYNNTVTGVTYDYPEFKGYHAEVHWVRVDAGPGSFSMINLTEGLFLRMLTPEQPPDPANTLMRFPEGDLSWLYGIAPIGTKFMAPEHLGPQSQGNLLPKGRFVEGRLLFFFGGGG